MKKIRFTPAEAKFLSSNEACRVASCKDSIPHVVPVSYYFEHGKFFFATDYGTKKLENIKANGNLALTVDTYSSVGNKAVCVQGRAELIESGAEFRRLYRIFSRKFDWVRADPWEEGEAPFVMISPFSKVSWGMR